VNGRRIEALGCEEFQRSVLALQIDRADLSNHDTRDLPYDAVEFLLALSAIGHDLAQAAHDDAERGFAR
jgi:hypothetical protein